MHHITKIICLKLAVFLFASFILAKLTCMAHQVAVSTKVERITQEASLRSNERSNISTKLVNKKKRGIKKKKKKKKKEGGNQLAAV